MVLAALPWPAPELVPLRKVEIRGNGSRKEKHGLQESFEVGYAVDVDFKSPPIKLVHSSTPEIEAVA